MFGGFRTIAALTWLALPGAALAHPHIFVATGLRVVAEEGRITGIEVAWQYDEFYSLLVLEDMELDGDYDGKLTEAELARLSGFDMHWIDGFEGDLYLAQEGAAVALGAPEPRGTAFEDGKITTRHFRPLAQPVAGAVAVKAYDPTFYTAYDLGLGVDVPEGCRVAIRPADIGAAQKALLAELAEIPEDGTVPFPEVGAQFADTVEVTCAAPS
ncbi:DUF1007 family protein [Marimonas lutisalis]|uniref:DUF1007 family protein n=1 Tax=Marimonas lutisalis TaxID=2545756 RepID=UPI0010F7BAD5|nr:DUF1007 family protein [Marimonas lutisalis]